MEQVVVGQIHSNIQPVHVSESYKFFESISVGPFTLQFWSVSSFPSSSFASPTKSTPASHQHISSPSTVQKLHFKSYLPQGTHGISLPHFTTTLHLHHHHHHHHHYSTPHHPGGGGGASGGGGSGFSYPSSFVSSGASSVYSTSSPSCFSGVGLCTAATATATATATSTSTSTSTPPSSPSSTTGMRFPSVTGGGGGKLVTERWQMAIYKDGSVVPLPHLDDDLKCFAWVHRPGGGPWMNHYFTKEEILHILRDLTRTFEPWVVLPDKATLFADSNGRYMLLGAVAL